METRLNPLLRQAELDLGSDDLRDLEALRRMRSCPWGYGFDTHLKGVKFQAALYARKLIWC